MAGADCSARQAVTAAIIVLSVAVAGALATVAGCVVWIVAAVTRESAWLAAQAKERDSAREAEQARDAALTRAAGLESALTTAVDKLERTQRAYNTASTLLAAARVSQYVGMTNEEALAAINAELAGFESTERAKQVEARERSEQPGTALEKP